MSGRPERAAVSIDGERVGSLPLQVELPPGSHRLHVEAPHYLPAERVIDLALGERKSVVDIELPPIIGRATFDVRTPGAEVVLVSGSDRKEHLDLDQPVELDLSRTWMLEAKRDGYRRKREPLDWGDSQEKTFVVALDKVVAAAVVGEVGEQRRVAAPESSGHSSDALRTAMMKALKEPSDGAKAPSSEPAASNPPREPCVLKINSIPVSNVFLDNVRLGITPILGVTARAGTHVVQFLQGDKKKSASFVCKPGESKAVSMNLNR
jgi:hypothetical protein